MTHQIIWKATEEIKNNAGENISVYRNYYETRAKAERFEIDVILEKTANFTWGRNKDGNPITVEYELLTLGE